jgi:hypothetical protein
MAQRHPRKRLKVSDIVIGAIATEARSFTDAGRLCMGDRMHGSIPGPIGPGIVCMSFAVELWFKAFGCLSNPSGDVPTGHDLAALFNGLSPDIQDALIARCGQPRAYFLNVLQEDARTFEVWRYAFEQEAIQAGSPDGLIVLGVHLLLTDTLPMVCDQVYEEFKSVTRP